MQPATTHKYVLGVGCIGFSFHLGGRMYGIVAEAAVWLAALARAAWELLRRELREGIEALDYPEPIFGDSGYPDERE